MKTFAASTILVSPLLEKPVDDLADKTFVVSFQDGGKPFEFQCLPEIHLGLNGFVINMAPNVGHPDVTIRAEAIQRGGFTVRVSSNISLGVVTTIRFSYIAIGY